jgi:hypothetical protein
VRRAMLSLTLPVLLIAGARSSEAGSLDARIGGFFPRMRDCGIPSDQPAKYTLFQDDCELYFVGKGDFDSLYGGIEYSGVLSPYLEVGVSVDGFSRSVDTSYRDYTRADGSEIRQTLKLTSVPVGVTVRIIPTSKRVRVAPYVGGGIDAVFYTYEEFGDFIDFFDPDLPVIADSFRSESVAFGVHAVGGVRFYLNRDFAITGEGKYLWAGDDMGDDFAPNEPGLVNRIDLSGWAFTVGLHVRF